MRDLKQNNFLVFGHRGAPAHAPENTIVSFKKAIKLGADGLELDVQETVDGKLVIHHDLHLQRLGVQKNVDDLTFEEIRKLNASLDWESEYGFQPIPALEEILELLEGNDIILNIEIKSPGFLPTGVVGKTVEFIKQHNLAGRCIVSSFNPLIIRKVKKLLPDVFTALIWSWEDVHWSLLWFKPLYWICSPDGFNPDIQFLNKEIVDWAKAKNMKICVFTVNNPGQLDFVKKLGVDGIFTDDPMIIDKNPKNKQVRSVF